MADYGTIYTNVISPIPLASSSNIEGQNLFKWNYKYCTLIPAVHGAIGYSQKSSKLMWQCHQFLSRFLANLELFQYTNILILTNIFPRAKN